MKPTIIAAAVLVLAAPLGSRAASGAERRLNGHVFTLPDGFDVEPAAGPPQVDRPIVADFDDQGRLYVADSSGSNEPVEVQLKTKPHRIVRLEDADGDGRFEKSVVFADRMMFPEGVLWHDGAVYVAAPPVIWKLEDEDGDGVADRRRAWFDGKTLTGCANDLHGPYLGPDGWIYWAKGAFAKQIHDRPGRKPISDSAAHVFRARPDGSDLEAVISGGMDNPVEVAFTPEGEAIFTTTFFVHPGGADGKRDGLVHAIYGGVYPKVHGVLDGLKRTGELMPALAHLGPSASSGLAAYESAVFGEEFRGNLFSTLFNMRKVMRHALKPAGATFESANGDFLVSDHADFHPTDVIEDADGSLLVVDTGGWYKLCCPSSHVARPEALGAIYRVQKRGAAGPADPRGLKLDWRSMDAAALVRLLDDSRPAVRRRAVALLARGADSSMDAIESALSGGASVEARRNAVWASSRAGGARGRAAVRAALKDESSSVRQAALHAAGLERDREAFESFVASLSDSSEALQRVAATALGRLGDARAVPALLGAAARPRDRAGEHAIIYALIEIGDRAAVSEGLSAASPHARRAALIALDQMDGGGVQAKDVAPLLGDAEPALRETAAWIAGFHPEWGKELAGQFGARLAVEIPEPERDAFASQLAGFARGDAARDLLAAALGDPSTPAANRLVVLQAMARAALREAPAPWLAAWARALEGASAETAAEVVRAARALPWPKDGAADLAAALERQGRDASKSASLRLESLAALPAGLAAADEATLEFLIAALDAERPPLERAAAASVLARTPLGEVELRRLAAALEGAGPLELGRLLMAFERSPSGAVGAALLSALEKARGLSSLRAPELAALLSKFPAAVQERGKALLAQLQVDAAEKEARLDALLAQTSKGDARRGLIVFKGPKAACVTCHAIGYVGGKAGPDLSKIGAIRTERDLLESILFPSASFVRSYEPVVLTTKDGRVLAGVLKSDSAEWFTVVIAADNEVRVERSAIADLKAGEASIMPQGLEEQLTVEELMDLVAFMRSMK